MDRWREAEGKRVHDPWFYQDRRHSAGAGDGHCMTTKPGATAKAIRRVWVPGPIIVGAKPSRLVVAACLKEKGVPSLILERANCIASLWQLKTYDRLHLPMQFCELPLMPFPKWFPTYPTKQQFITYLEDYASRFDIRPAFNETVVSAEYDAVLGFWSVRTEATNAGVRLELLVVKVSPNSGGRRYSLGLTLPAPALTTNSLPNAGVGMRIRVRGGGKTSQIYAIRQSIAKALVAFYQK
ncbi:hypothetical protein COCNU_scaffold005435G000010 [Cocos nucifera]|nr:hypothetical protein [Cocos nucifera]